MHIWGLVLGRPALAMRGAAGGAFRVLEVLAGRRVRRKRAGRGCRLLAPVAARAAGVGGAHHHVAAAGGVTHAGGDSRGSTACAEIATDDATAGAADA